MRSACRLPVTHKPRLLFLGAFPPPSKKIFGGNITACKTLLEAGLGDHLDLILVDSTQRAVPPPPAWIRLLDAGPRMLKFLALAWSKKPDAALIFSSTGLSFSEKSLLAVISRLFGVRVLFFPRGGRLMDDCRLSGPYRRYVRLMMRFPDILLCQGQAWSQFFIKDLGLMPAKCVILSNWTATRSLLKIGAERHYDTPHSLKILFLGRVFRSKGIFELLDAFSLLLHRFSDAELLIAGEGKDLDEARAYVHQNGFAPSVRFLGWVEGDAKKALLSEADIFCLPSRAEGLPNAMIEAMAAGLPIVVTPVGSIPDVIVDGENGFLIPVQDTAALAQRFEMLFEAPALRRALGQSARATAKSNFNAADAAKQLTLLVAGARTL
jgi:glycosyltransferase involved in cell wall biosynthesis